MNNFRARRHGKKARSFLALFLLFFAGIAQAGEIEMTGTWKGSYATEDPNTSATVTIILKRAAAGYSGTIAMPDENINLAIKNSQMDAGYFSVSAVMPVQTAEGGMAQAFVIFGGFVDGPGNAWDGMWTVTDKDGNVFGGNTFSASRDGAPASGTQPTGTWNANGLWQGSYQASNQTGGVMTIEVVPTGGGYAGTGKVVDTDGTELPPIRFHTGQVTGNKFSLSGSMLAIGQDGEQIPASVTLNGELSANGWRGTLMVKPEGDDYAALTATFRLQRSGGTSQPGGGQGGMWGQTMPQGQGGGMMPQGQGGMMPQNQGGGMWGQGMPQGQGGGMMPQNQGGGMWGQGMPQGQGGGMMPQNQGGGVWGAGAPTGQR